MYMDNIGKEHTYPPQLVLGLKVLGVLIGIFIIITVCIFAWFRIQQGLITETPQEVTSVDDSDASELLEYIYIEPQSFVYILVPNATTTITLPPPADSNTEEAEYELAVATLSEEQRLAVDSDTMYALPFGVGTYEDFLENLPDEDRYLLYQIHDELRQLTFSFNQQYKSAPLFERYPAVVQLTSVQPVVYGEETSSVYPSIRAVEGFFISELYTRVNPTAATYTQIAEDFAQRGIAYGLYGQGDVDAARELVAQYFDELETAPNYLSMRTRLQNSN
jgi:hypothetical protein